MITNWQIRVKNYQSQVTKAVFPTGTSVKYEQTDIKTWSWQIVQPRPYAPGCSTWVELFLIALHAQAENKNGIICAASVCTIWTCQEV